MLIHCFTGWRAVPRTIKPVSRGSWIELRLRVVDRSGQAASLAGEEKLVRRIRFAVMRGEEVIADRVFVRDVEVGRHLGGRRIRIGVGLGTAIDSHLVESIHSARPGLANLQLYFWVWVAGF